MSQRLIDFLSRTDVWAVAAAVAGFLTLTWVIRGAPIGQATREEPDEAPSPGYRDRVVASAVVGFLLVLAGAYLATTVGIPWSLPAFAVGFGVVLAVLRVNRRYRHVSPTLRRVLEFSHTALTASLVLGILVVGNVVAFKYGGRAVDMTRDRAFSLSSKTLNLLGALDRPVTFRVSFGNSENSARRLDRVRQLLALYKAASPSKVRVDFLNPFVDVKEYEELVRRVPDMAATGGDGIVVDYGEGGDAPRLVLGTRDLFDGPGVRPGARPDRLVTTFRGEDVVTSALIRLREGKRSKIGFTTGHGEPAIGELDPSRPGLGLWRARLSSVGIDAVEAGLRTDDVPADVSLLVICGPRSPFGADELERLRAFVIRGGQLIVLVGNVEPSGLDDFLRTYNVEVGPGMAVDPRFNYRGRAYFVYAPIAPGANHPIVGPIAGRAVLLQYAAPLELLGVPGPGGQPSKKSSNPGVIAAPFLKTSPGSWSETDAKARPVTRDPAKDGPGPLTVGAAVSIRPAIASEPPSPRMVVLSSPPLADNGLLQVEPTNLDLLMNALYWLRGRPEMLGIDPQTHESPTFVADPGLQFRLVIVPTLMAFVVIVGLGATTYLARRD